MTARVAARPIVRPRPSTPAESLENVNQMRGGGRRGRRKKKKKKDKWSNPPNATKPRSGEIIHLLRGLLSDLRGALWLRWGFPTAGSGGLSTHFVLLIATGCQ
jgi:hypothetical protein